MGISDDQELWGIALWLEQRHGDNSWLYIAEQKDRSLAEGDSLGALRWEEVERRLGLLRGQDETRH